MDNRKTDRNNINKDRLDKPGTSKSSKSYASRRSSAKSQSDFIKFMVLTGLGGLFVLLLMFGIFFSMMSGDEKKENKNNSNVSQEEKNLEDNSSSAPSGEVEKITGVVSKEAQGNVIEIVNVNTGEGIILKIDTGTELKDAYGEAMTLKEFKIGDIIQTKYDKGNRVAEYFRISAEGWEKTGVKDFKIDKEAKTIEVGSNLYSYTDKIITTNKNGLITINDISSKDSLTLKGYQDKVWYINVEKSHGFLKINAADDEEGTIEIGNHISMNLSEAKNIELEEGRHKIVIKKEDYEPLVKNIDIEAGQTYEIDLKEMKKKVGKLQVIAKGLSDYKIYIDDIEYPANEIILLEYGEYNLVVRKEGYKDWSRKFKIQQEMNRIELALEKEPEAGLVKLVVDTDPQGAEVYIDGEYMGISPVECQLRFGQYNLSIKKEGYSPIHFPVNLEEGRKERQFLFTLQEDNSTIVED
ncbi:MAG TPA: PEGA domain-containing protein [Defluviitaleaceae bacterium]|nr:PEGA domain-containing protein [Candidatus Epulonipiscium sp.]HOQ17750.1 PEGA domain-containing protein [Defluviitaleaceae bacterium]HQD51027.1 PEGA domain-containing protein [Defluviitaleaceae bacterium]